MIQRENSVPTHDGPVEAALAEYFSRVDRGESVDLPQLIAAYPGCEGGLHRFLNQERKLKQAVIETPPTATPPENLAGRTLGDYRIVRELGHGGMGVVYEVEQLSLGRRVALKVLPFAAMLSKQQLVRFKNEARAAATLDDPHIVAIYSVGSEGDVHYYAMQLIDGPSLAQVIATMRRAQSLSLTSAEKQLADAILSPDDAQLTTDSNQSAIGGSQPKVPSPPSPIGTLPRDPASSLPAFGSREFYCTVARLGIDAAEALDHAHQNGILHRDIKPGNLLLDSDGKLYVTDFGLARIEADAGMTMTGDIIGTLRYMAPEQALAKRVVVDHRADIYSLGATLYELLTLEPPFGETDRSELLKQIAFNEPRAPRQIDRGITVDLETIVLKAMAKSTADRYATAQALADDLQRFLDGRPIQAKPISLGERAFRWANRNRSLATAAVGALVILTAVAISASGLILSANSRTATALSASRDSEAKARESERKTRELLYAADMTLAGAAWHKNEPAQVRMILDRYAQPKTRADGSLQEDPRGFEWYFLDRQIRRHSELLFQNDKALYLIDFISGGKEFFTAGQDSVVRWHNADSGKVVRSLDTQQQEVNGVSYNPTGTLLATAGDDGTLKIWHATELTLLHSIKAIDGICYFAKFVDNELVFTGGDTKFHRLFNAATGELVREFVSPDATAPGVTSPASTEACISRATDRVWTRVGSSERRRYEGIYEWDLATGKSRRINKEAYISRVLADRAEQFLFTSMSTGYVCILEAESGAERWSTRLANNLEALALSPDESRFAVGERNGGQVYLWKLDLGNSESIVASNTPEKLSVHDRDVYGIVFTPDGKSMLTVSRDGSVRRTPLEVSAKTFREVAWLTRQSVCAGIPRTNLVVTAAPLAVHNRTTGELIKTLSSSTFHAVAVSADGTMVAAGSAAEVGVWNVTTGKQVLHVNWPHQSTFSLDFSPDNSRLVILSDQGLNGRIDVIEIETEKSVRYSEPTNSAAGAYFCSGDGLIELDSTPYQLKARNVRDRTVRWQTKPMDTRNHQVVPSPDRTLLIVQQGLSLKLIDCATGAVRYQVPCDYRIESFAFLGDGRSFVVADTQGRISVWNTSTGQQLFELSNVGPVVRGIVPLDEGVLVKVDGMNGQRRETHWLEF